MSFELGPGERVVLDEDCSEDKLRSGMLFLTNKRLVFQKTQGRMATLSKKEGDVVLDIPLDRASARSEGFLVKKLVITEGQNTYKFGVFSNTKWERQIKGLQQASAK